MVARVLNERRSREQNPRRCSPETVTPTLQAQLNARMCLFLCSGWVSGRRMQPHGAHRCTRGSPQTLWARASGTGTWWQLLRPGFR